VCERLPAPFRPRPAGVFSGLSRSKAPGRRKAKRAEKNGGAADDSTAERRERAGKDALSELPREQQLHARVTQLTARAAQRSASLAPRRGGTPVATPRGGAPPAFGKDVEDVEAGFGSPGATAPAPAPAPAPAAPPSPAPSALARISTALRGTGGTEQAAGRRAAPKAPGRRELQRMREAVAIKTFSMLIARRGRGAGLFVCAWRGARGPSGPAGAAEPRSRALFPATLGARDIHCRAAASPDRPPSWTRHLTALALPPPLPTPAHHTLIRYSHQTDEQVAQEQANARELSYGLFLNVRGDADRCVGAGRVAGTARCSHQPMHI
jgi:hypothetical protein